MLRFPFLHSCMFYFHRLALILLKFTDPEIARVAVQWIMSVKITGWSSEYTNRMCYEDAWGSSSLGIFLLSSCRQIYHVEVKGGTPAEERELSAREGGRSAGYPQASLLLRVFFSSFWKTRGFAGCLLREVHKAAHGELQTHVWRVTRSQGADRC